MTLFWFIFGVVVGQLTVMSLIIVVLVKILNQQLVGFAVEKCETIPDRAIPSAGQALTVIVAGGIPPGVEEKLLSVVRRKADGPMSIIFKQDKTILGGIKLEFPGVIVDYSLRSKLKESGLIGKIFGCA